MKRMKVKRNLMQTKPKLEREKMLLQSREKTFKNIKKVVDRVCPRLTASGLIASTLEGVDLFDRCKSLA